MYLLHVSIFYICLLYQLSLFSSSSPPPPPLPPPSISFPPGCRSLFLRAKFTFRYRARAGWARLANPPMLVKLWNYVSPEFVSKDSNTEAPSWEQDKLFSTCFTTRVSRVVCHSLFCHWFSDPSHVSPWLILIFVFYAEKIFM